MKISSLISSANFKPLILIRDADIKTAGKSGPRTVPGTVKTAGAEFRAEDFAVILEREKKIKA